MHLDDDRLTALSSGAPMRGEERTHLQGCTRCRPLYRERRASHRLLAAGRLPAFDELTEKRIERHVVDAMAHAIRTPAPERAPLFSLRLVVPLALAAGIAALVLIPRTPSLPAALPAVETVAAVESATKTLAVAWSGERRETLREGAHLEASDLPTSLQTASATGLELAPHSRVHLERLGEGDTVVALEAGRIAVEVKPLLPGQRFAVRVDEVEVQVVGTAFTVARGESGLDVTVDHGRVRLVSPGRAGERFVSGGEHLHLAPHAPLEAAATDHDLGSTASSFPLGFADEPPGGAVRPPLSHGRHAMQVAVPAEPAHTVAPTPAAPAVAAVSPRAARPRGETPAATTPAAQAAAAAAEPEPTRLTFQEAFHEAAQGREEDVRRCWLQGGSVGPRQLHLVLTIQSNGRVAPQVHGEEPGLPGAFLDCVTAKARSWTFPAAGRAYEVSIPYRVGLE